MTVDDILFELKLSLSSYAIHLHLQCALLYEMLKSTSKKKFVVEKSFEEHFLHIKAKQQLNKQQTQIRKLNPNSNVWIFYVFVFILLYVLAFIYIYYTIHNTQSLYPYLYNLYLYDMYIYVLCYSYVSIQLCFSFQFSH